MGEPVIPKGRLFHTQMGEPVIPKGRSFPKPVIPKG
jgi:hypothetical protein